MSLWHAPFEIAQIILANLDNDADVSALSRVNRSFCDLFREGLFKRNIRYSGCSALFWAALQNVPGPVKLMLAAGAPVDHSLSIAQFQGLGKTFEDLDMCYACKSALHIATSYTNLETMKCLLDNGADIHSVNYLGQEALYYCNFTRIDAVKLLIDHGANVAAIDRVGGHILLLVVQGGNRQVLEFLLHNGAVLDAEVSKNNHLMMAAARAGNVSKAKVLAEHGASVEEPCEDSQSFFYYAAL